MRLLIVNPNTSPGVTARIDAAAQAVAGPADRFTTVQAVSGPPLIVTEADAAAATVGVLAAVARHRDPVDGIVLASFGDTGAGEVRAAYPACPVVGIAEAAFAEAKEIGGSVSIVTFAPELAASLREKAVAHGLGELLSAVVSPPGPLRHDPAEVADRLLVPLTVLCQDCAAQGSASIVMGGGPLAGIATRIAPRCPVPVIDGTQAAIARLRAVSSGRAKAPAAPT
jgi:Asp/Glu/hydantoin racemase